MRITLLFTMSANRQRPGKSPTAANLFSSDKSFDHPALEAAGRARGASPFAHSGEAASTNKLKDRLAEPRSGGARRDRTDDLMLAKHALSQLSYGPEENGEP